ncbi:MAG TPA: aspartyl/asparaginyl beta-hydroxylase domain-containing protein [Sphingomicrobium sp.]|jgi:hypothetical protein|nr:aspartyl/asparaginyl beta-hydroxylase domain-containing protein [Sphingomicrobium sp.]
MIDLKKPFYKLPIRFDAELLARELAALPESAWTPHPTGFVGNEAVRLVTPGGHDTDAIEGAMAPTEHLLACRYAMESMAALGGVWGRSRFMGLAPDAEVPEHIDSNYYWRTHLRIHVPVVTNPNVIFTCGGESVHMAAGECWAFDSFRLHRVHNGGDAKRVHLVIDTVATDRLWDLLEGSDEEAGLVQPGTVDPRSIMFEQVNRPKVMSPWEVRIHIDYLLGHSLPDPKLDQVKARLDRFVCGWQGAWARFADSDAGLPVYRQLIEAIRLDLQQIRGGHIMLDNTQTLYFFLDRMVFTHALIPPRRPGMTAVPAQGARRLAS